MRPQDAEDLLLALATRRPLDGYNTVEEAARGLLGFVQRQRADLDTARTRLDELEAAGRAVVSAARAPHPDGEHSLSAVLLKHLKAVLDGVDPESP